MKSRFISPSLMIVIFVSVIHDCGTEASCMKSLAECCGLKSGPFILSQEHYEQWYRPDLAVEVLEEAYGVIDEYLRTKVGTANLETNIEEMTSVLKSELIAADPGRRSCNRWFKHRQSLAVRLQSKDPAVIINALYRLIKLEDTDASGIKCSVSVTRTIGMNNEIANDPISRRNRGEPAIFSRIDNLIVNSAIERAHFCLPVYRDQLRAIARIESQHVVNVRKFWTMILGRRMRNVNIGEMEADLDMVFTWYPKDAVDQVKDMQHAVEDNEVDLVINFLDGTPQSVVQYVADQHFPEEAGSARVSKFKGCLVGACIVFNRLVFLWYESLDFDMKLRDHIPALTIEMVELDLEVNKLRAFHYMCRKMLDEKERIIELINRQEESHNSTSAELDLL